MERALAATVRGLLSSRAEVGHWEGDLSTSALSTATAAFALDFLDRELGGSSHETLVRRGLDWLALHVNPDCGWGDTIRSASNLSTTVLCWAALGSSPAARQSHRGVIERAEAWIVRQAGGVEPARLAPAIEAVYGKDRTFSVPILMVCALAGRLGPHPAGWDLVPQLPFELAALPQAWFRFLGLPVVSYALPALIAIGQGRHHRRPSRNPIVRSLRRLAREPTLRLLERIQPSSGGFLEAVPLTAFVIMSLAASEEAKHPVAQRCAAFLERSQRVDGSWAIDSNLATWVTTLSVNALADAGVLDGLAEGERIAVREWLLAQQHREIHPYTGARPGGWAWTDLPGGVPDADDTAGALLALRRLGAPNARTIDAASAGIHWLLDLQNRDGGVPTFCRGWGRLPFDRSGADLTAHALRALQAWRGSLPPRLARRALAATDRAVAYLAREQREEGAWAPLWFGNELCPGLENLTYGTASVLIGLRSLDGAGAASVASLEEAAERWLLNAQDESGGWGGARAIQPSIEETALAVKALSARAAAGSSPAREAALRGAFWLVGRVEAGVLEPSPIGFYFANLWYYERLYPWIFALGALGRAPR
ncbi:MAG TPA: prenyltransferase/squalene oxidase repeat-containing protein [Planctomycetota bacterium]|nr:prenyltransferase/squalene oxidase repeat-containing protein [Planctomycetota bacterium]